MHFSFFFFFGSLFISMSCFNQASRLDSIPLCTFSLLIHDLVLVINSVYVQHILFCHESWLVVFQPFQFLVFLVKMVNRHDVHLILQYSELQLQVYIFIIILIAAFYEVFDKLRCIFKLFKTTYR